MVFGLFLMGLVRFPFLQKEAMLNLPEPLRKYGKISSFLFGASIAFGWTPCVGPILGAVLTIAATRGEIIQGFILLSIFSLDFSVFNCSMFKFLIEKESKNFFVYKFC